MDGVFLFLFDFLFVFCYSYSVAVRGPYHYQTALGLPPHRYKRSYII